MRGGAPVGWLAVLRATRRDLAVRLTVVVLVGLTAIFVAGAPRRLDAMADRGLRAALGDGGPAGRELQLDTIDWIEPGSPADPLARVAERSRRDLEVVPAGLRSKLVQRHLVIDSARHDLQSLPGRRKPPYQRYLTLRSQLGAGERIRYVDGRPPQPTDDSMTVAGSAGAESAAAVVEIALSADSARLLDMRVGESLVLTPDNEDQVTRLSVTLHQVDSPTVVRLAGVFQPVDPADRFWTADPSLLRPLEVERGDRLLVFGFGLFEPTGYADVRAAMPQLAFKYLWRYEVDPQRVDGDDIDSLHGDVVELRTTTPSSGDSRLQQTSTRTGLLTVLDRLRVELSFARSVTGVVFIGLLGVALTVLALVALLSAERRRSALALVRGRGGSPAQVVTGHLVEAAALCLPAALVGFLAASRLVPGGSAGQSLALALTFGACAALVVTAAVVPHARRQLTALDRGDLVAGGLSPRRLVLEGLVVLVAVAGLLALRRRGLDAQSSARADAGFDVYLAAVPLLLGLAAGLVALRAYPAPLRVLARLSARRRGAVPFLALSRVARAPAVTAVPLLVLLLAVALATFASVVRDTVTSAQRSEVWQQVGADHRIDAPTPASLGEQFDVADVPGVRATARSYVEQRAAAGRGVASRPIIVVAIDAPAYQAVVRGTPLDTPLPRSFLAGPDDRAARVPMLLSQQFAAAEGLGVGDPVAVQVGGRPVPGVVVGLRERLAGVAPGRAFAVLPLVKLAERVPTRTTRLYVRADDGAESAVAAAARTRSPAAVVASRATQYASARSAPLVSGTVGAFTTALIVSALYAALGIVVGTTLTARARAKDLAFLRTLGLADRQADGLVVAELAPMVAVAGVLGALLGVGTAALVTPRLGVGRLTGSLQRVVPSVDPAALAAVAAALVVVVVAAIVVSGAITRRTNITTTLRVGER